MEFNLKKSIQGLIAMLVLLGAYIYGEYDLVNLNRCLEQEGVFTKAEITRSYVYKGNNIEAPFQVEGKKYIARDIMYRVEVGDSIFIHYCASDPTMYRTYRDDPRINP